MTDGGDWMSRGRFDSGEFDADDPRYADEFRTDAGQAGRPGPGPRREADARGWTGESERPGYGRPGPTEGAGDPYSQARYPDSAPYSTAAGYGDQGGYGDHGGYQGGYGTADEYRGQGGY